MSPIYQMLSNNLIYTYLSISTNVDIYQSIHLYVFLHSLYSTFKMQSQTNNMITVFITTLSIKLNLWVTSVVEDMDAVRYFIFSASSGERAFG